MSSEEFGRLKLPELNALSRCYFERVKREDWRTALIVATMLNIVRAKDSPVVRPETIMPWLDGEKSVKPEEHRQTPEEARALIEAITRELGGIVVTRPNLDGTVSAYPKQEET